MLGLAFKSGTDDLRNSPAVLLVQKLVARGAFVTVYDPVATDLAKPILDGSVTYATDPLSALKNCDVAVIGTGWPEWRQLDWSEVRSVMRGRTLFDAVILSVHMHCRTISSASRLDQAADPNQRRPQSAGLQTAEIEGKGT